MPLKMPLVDKVGKWMDENELEMTVLRAAFLRKYQALLSLRGFKSLDPRSVVSAMEVILNFRRKPSNQDSYLRAVCRNLDKLIVRALGREAFMMRGGQASWDCPGHVGQPGWHVSVAPDQDQESSDDAAEVAVADAAVADAAEVVAVAEIFHDTTYRDDAVLVDEMRQ